MKKQCIEGINEKKGFRNGFVSKIHICPLTYATVAALWNGDP
jgi:hypothetical protein